MKQKKPPVLRPYKSKAWAWFDDRKVSSLVGKR